MVSKYTQEALRRLQPNNNFPNSKWITDLCVKCKTIELLEITQESIEVPLDFMNSFKIQHERGSVKNIS